MTRRLITSELDVEPVDCLVCASRYIPTSWDDGLVVTELGSAPTEAQAIRRHGDVFVADYRCAAGHQCSFIVGCNGKPRVRIGSWQPHPWWIT